MNESSISIQDIECPTLRSQVKALFEDLIQLCPSDSTVRASISRIHGRFLGEIRVASESVFMQAMDQATAVTDVLEHIRTQMLSQIIDWRAHRFAS